MSDLTGQRFGRLLIVERYKGGARWQCLCDCGKRPINRGPDLLAGRVISCGCAKRDATRERHEMNAYLKRLEKQADGSGEVLLPWN